VRFFSTHRSRPGKGNLDQRGTREGRARETCSPTRTLRERGKVIKKREEQRAGRGIQMDVYHLQLEGGRVGDDISSILTPKAKKMNNSFGKGKERFSGPH